MASDRSPRSVEVASREDQVSLVVVVAVRGGGERSRGRGRRCRGRGGGGGTVCEGFDFCVIRRLRRLEGGGQLDCLPAGGTLYGR